MSPLRLTAAAFVLCGIIGCNYALGWSVCKVAHVCHWVAL